MYIYKAKCERVVDGDTIDANIDLGFDTWKKIRIRLVGVNAAESRTKDLEEKARGLAAKQFVIDILKKHKRQNKFLKRGVVYMKTMITIVSYLAFVEHLSVMILQ